MRVFGTLPMCRYVHILVIWSKETSADYNTFYGVRFILNHGVHERRAVENVLITYVCYAPGVLF